MAKKAKSKNVTVDEEPEATIKALAKDDDEPLQPMTRTKRKLNVVEEPEIEWMKTSGTFYFKGERYTRGDRFKAKQSEIPMAFRDTIRPLQELPQQTQNIQFVPAGYKITPAAQDGFYDIVNSQNVKLNRKPLTQIEAEATVQRLA